MNRNKANSKRKVIDELTDKNEIKESSPHEEKVTLINKKKKYLKTKKSNNTFEVNYNPMKFKSPTPTPTYHFQQLLTSSPPQNVSLSGPPLMFNDVRYRMRPGSTMNPSMFLEIYQEYEQMLQQIPSSRIFSAERMRDLIPFTYFFTTIMRAIQISREYHNESLEKNRPAAGDGVIIVPVGPVDAPTTINNCSKCVNCRKTPQSPPH